MVFALVSFGKEILKLTRKKSLVKKNCYRFYFIYILLSSLASSKAAKHQVPHCRQHLITSQY